MLKILLILFIALASCNAKTINPNQQEIVFSKFPKETKVSFNNFLKFDKGTINKLFLKDTNLIVYNSNGISDFFFYRYSINSKKLSEKYIKGGRAFGEAFGSLSSGLYNNKLWLYDVTTNKLLIRDLVKPRLVMEYKIPKFYYSIQLIDSLTFMAVGAYHSKYKLQEVDIKSSKERNEFGTFENVPDNIPFYSWKRAYEGFLFVNKQGNKNVIAYRFTDQIEIFDLVKKTSKIIKGPENYKPEFTPFRANNQDFMQRNEKSRFAFVGGTTTNNYIYLLYSGNQHSSKYLDYGKFIYVYDWEGKPVKKLNLSKYVSGFTITDDDTTIYAFDVVSNFIIKTKI